MRVEWNAVLRFRAVLVLLAVLFVGCGAVLWVDGVGDDHRPSVVAWAGAVVLLVVAALDRRAP